VTGLSHYILEALDVELSFPNLVCLALKKRGQVFFSHYFPFPRFCACIKRKDAKTKAFPLGNGLYIK